VSFGAAFLATPRLPDPAAPPWGGGALEIAFAGGPYRISGLAPDQEARARQRFRQMLTTGTPPAAELRLLRAPPEHFADIPRMPWTYTLDLRAGPDQVEVAGLLFQGLLDPGGREGRLWTPLAGGGDFVGVLENFFRILVAYRLLALGGVLLHSAGVVDRGRARLFFGPSNAGKTTAARISAGGGRQVLSDDLNAVVPDGAGGLEVEKLPFAGEYGQTGTPSGRYPLAGCYRLEKGARTVVSDLGTGAAVGALLACTPYVNADPLRQERLLDNLQRLCHRVPVRRLAFPRDGDFWPILYESDQE